MSGEVAKSDEADDSEIQDDLCETFGFEYIHAICGLAFHPRP